MFLAEGRNIIVAGNRSDGRPHVTPNWFSWDGERFYVSTTRSRAKYRIFTRDPRAMLVVDDSTGYRAVLISATAGCREDIASELEHFRAIWEKHGASVPSDEGEHVRMLKAESRVLLVFTPEGPPETWPAWGLD